MAITHDRLSQDKFAAETATHSFLVVPPVAKPIKPSRELQLHRRRLWCVNVRHGYWSQAEQGQCLLRQPGQSFKGKECA